MGSASCLWKDGSGRRYVISAAHVVGHLSDNSPVLWVGINGEIGTGFTMAPGFYWKRVDDGDLDAGPVLVQEPGPFAFAASYPWGAPVESVNQIRPDESVGICGKWGLVFATFAGLGPERAFFNGHVHSRLLRFRYDPASEQLDASHDMTDPGDSGAPIVSMFDGALLAIHVAREITGNERFSLGVPAEDVLAAFQHDLPGFTLVTP